MKKRGMHLNEPVHWVEDIASGKVDFEDFEEVLDELTKMDQNGVQGFI